jgi:hypothetical protein
MIIGLGAAALAVTIGDRSVYWHGVCEDNRDKFSDDPCAVHALLGSLSETRPFSWFLSLTPTTRSLELIEATKRHDELVAAGRHAEALPYAMDALWLHVRVFGQEHPNNVVMLENLAARHRSLGDADAAAKLEARAAAIRTRSGR